jgi:hypothetical protein
VAEDPAQGHAQAGAHEQHGHLDGEGLAPPLGRVVVADQAGGRRLGHGLAEAQ